MRIALTTNGLWPATVGGIERHTHFLSTHLTELGAQVTVLTPEERPDTPNETPYEVRWLAAPSLPSYWLELQQRARLFRKALKQGTYDVVYGQGATCAEYVRLKDRPPVIWNPHGLELFHATTPYLKLRTLPFRPLCRRLARRAECSVSLGGRLDDIFREGLGVPDERMVVLPNGIDPSYVQEQLPATAERSETELLWVGRIQYNKGVDLLIEAFNQLSGQDIGLTLVGSGPEADELKARSSNPRVRFAGRVSDEELYRLLAGSAGMVFSSRFEGMPTVILEAMTAGLPVVGTDIGAVATMVKNGETGILVEPGSADALREGMLQLVGWSEQRRRAVGEAARGHVLSNFTWSAIAQKTFALCEELTQGTT